MKSPTTTLTCALLIVCALAGHANSDVEAPPVYLHTKFQLPPPESTGEIIAEASYEMGTGSCYLHSLKLIVDGKTTIVPKEVIQLFPSPVVYSIQFFSAPIEIPKTHPDYYGIRFKYGYNSAWLPFSRDNATASIIFSNGKINSIYSDIEEHSEEKSFKTHIYRYDPIALKVVEHYECISE